MKKVLVICMLIAFATTTQSTLASPSTIKEINTAAMSHPTGG